MTTKLKNTWTSFLIIGSLFSIFSCDKVGIVESIKTVSYEYQNNTGVDLIMEVYNIDNNLIKTHNILKGEKIITNTTRDEGFDVFSYGSSTLEQGLYIVLKFKDGKCTYYSKFKGDKIFYYKNYDNYSEELIKGNRFTLVYILKTEDYKRAEKCK